MSSGPSLSQPHAPNTPRFRFSELLTSSPHDRPRTSSFKGKQAQQDPTRTPRIYGQCCITSAQQQRSPHLIDIPAGNHGLTSAHTHDGPLPEPNELPRNGSRRVHA